MRQKNPGAQKILKINTHTILGAGEIAQSLRELNDLAEGPSSVPNTNIRRLMSTPKQLQQVQHSLLASTGKCSHVYTHITHIIFKSLK